MSEDAKLGPQTPRAQDEEGQPSLIPGFLVELVTVMNPINYYGLTQAHLLLLLVLFRYCSASGWKEKSADRWGLAHPRIQGT